MTLTERIMRHPINDDAYLRHLRTADIFNEVQEARKEARKSQARLEAAIAKATIVQALEDLRDPLRS